MIADKTIGWTFGLCRDQRTKHKDPSRNHLVSSSESMHPISASHPDPDLIALGVRQPWAELIVRGIKTIEVRSVGTNVRGPIYLYASKKLSEIPAAIEAGDKHGLDLNELPRGVLVGTVEIVACEKACSENAEAACVPRSYLRNGFAWHLTTPRRLEEPLPVRFLPYGIWFYPFKRRGNGR